MSRGTNNLCFFCVTSFVTNKDFIKSYKKAKVTIDKNIRRGLDESQKNN